MLTEKSYRNKFTGITQHKEDISCKYANRETKTPDISETGR